MTDPSFRDQLADEVRSDLQPYVLDAYQRAQRVVDAWRDEDWVDYADLARRFAHVLAEAEARVQAAANQRAAEERIVAEATDLCWKATPFTEDEEGMVAAYLLPAGVVHRLLGALQGAGYPAAFRALAQPAPAGEEGL